MCDNILETLQRTSSGPWVTFCPSKQSYQKRLLTMVTCLQMRMSRRRVQGLVVSYTYTRRLVASALYMQCQWTIRYFMLDQSSPHCSQTSKLTLAWPNPVMSEQLCKSTILLWLWAPLLEDSQTGRLLAHHPQLIHPLKRCPRSSHKLQKQYLWR